ncbi:ANTAR domain-containing response regulator [Clostridium aciditolerans]|uniref:Stage 0 sporulation protein A homolog n=1 Tax=Clostridium aciditolerans TaxID=339861 RepID=A0A934M2A9_9CLOT|nr:response regulator [Clostridium aciditolerans]MBI6871947.1 response regulator [Clostridium aciditolerans]
MSKKIVIADDEPITRMDIREMLEEAGYVVVGEASDGFDAIEVCKKHLPNIVIMDIKMPLLDGINASKIIIQEGLADGIILLSAYSDTNFVEKAKDAGVIGYLVKPLDNKSLIPAIEVAMAKSNELKEMKNNMISIEKKLEARKVIEKAKGILMTQQGISEEEAFSMIRNLSMKKRVTMKDIAGIIIMSKDGI